MIWSWLASILSSRAGLQTTAPSTRAHEDLATASPSVDYALQVSTVFACVDLLARTIASMPVHVYRVGTGGQRRLDTAHPLYPLLHHAPNARNSAAEFWRVIAMNYFLRGNAYALIGRRNGRVVALSAISADQVQVHEGERATLTYDVLIEGTRRTLAASEVLHIRGPGNGAVGMSRLDMMAQTINAAVSMNNHNTRTYRNKARRPGLLFIDRVLNQEQRTAAQATFDRMLSGDATLSIVEGGFRYEPLGLTPADLQLLESRKFSVEEVCRWFGVPSVLVNDTSSSTSWGSGIAQIIEGFVKFTIRPELVTFEQALRLALLPLAERDTVQIEFSIDAILRASLKDRMEIYAKAVQNGIYTRNDARGYENMPPMEGGDVLTAQSNLVPLDMLGKVVTQTAPAGNASGSNDGTQDPAAQ